MMFSDSFESLKSCYNKTAQSHTNILDTHGKLCKQLEQGLTELNAKQIISLKQTEDDITESGCKVMEEVNEMIDTMNNKIETNDNESLKRSKKENDNINEISVGIQQLYRNNIKTSSLLEQTRTSLDQLCDKVELEFRQAKEQQCDNQRIHQGLKEKLVMSQTESDKIHEVMMKNIKVKYLNIKSTYKSNVAGY